MQTAMEADQKVTQAAQAADSEIRVTRRMEIGTAIQQGDVYVHRLPDDHPRGALIKKGNVQIAVGQGIGARHNAEGNVAVYVGEELPPGVRAPKDVRESELCGPVIVAEEEWSLTHPEHADHKLPAGVFGVTYQYDTRTMKRVID